MSDLELERARDFGQALAYLELLLDGNSDVTDALRDRAAGLVAKYQASERELLERYGREVRR